MSENHISPAALPMFFGSSAESNTVQNRLSGNICRPTDKAAIDSQNLTNASFNAGYSSSVKNSSSKDRDSVDHEDILEHVYTNNFINSEEAMENENFGAKPHESGCRHHYGVMPAVSDGRPNEANPHESEAHYLSHQSSCPPPQPFHERLTDTSSSVEQDSCQSCPHASRSSNVCARKARHKKYSHNVAADPAFSSFLQRCCYSGSWSVGVSRGVAVSLMLLGCASLLLHHHGAEASEFPDRECCDSAPPPPPQYHTTTSTTPSPRLAQGMTSTVANRLVQLASSPDPTGEAGGALGVRNCLLARQLCADDPACRSILEIIPRVCGPESVACSTVTVNKCLAALRTIQGFPYFQPTCLCREPHLDRECNRFREFIFDHPCYFVQKKDESPYAVHALPTCEYAMRACEQLPGCFQLYEDFREGCKVREDQCKMDHPEICLDAWTKLKLSPMFGCICPSDHQRKKCLRIYANVHENSCVDTFPASSAHPSHRSRSKGGAWGLILPPAPTMRPQPPPYLSPPPPMSRYPPPQPYYPQVLPRPNPQVFTAMPPHAGTITAEPLPPFSAQTHNVITVDHRQPSYRPLGNQGGIFPVSVIPSENSAIHRVATQIQNPLVDAPGGSRHVNSSRAQEVLGNGRRYAQGPHANSTLNGQMGSEWFITFTEVPLSHNAAQTRNVITVVHQPAVILPIKSKATVVEAATSTGPVPVLHSTCLTALQGCNDDPLCRRLLDPVLGVCGSECDREACMKNLRVFYRNVGFTWALEVAFCLCKGPSEGKSSATADKCLASQEKLHPKCARRPEGAGPMLCNRLAHACKEDKSCRHRLEFYEQACAVDSDTRRCAGSASECRRALLGILGTQLRNLCTCAAKDAADPRETYNCLDWQRILWFNPCVVESQTDYHREMLAGVGPEEEITTSANIVMTYTTTQSYTSGQVKVATDHVPLVIQPPGTFIPSPYTPPYSERPSISHPTAPPPPTLPPPTTTPATTLPPRYCEKGGDDNFGAEYIIEGGGKRYYKAYDSTCSELCWCHPNDQLVCRVLDCIEAHTCSSGVAIYTHAMPAYQRNRGNCICYSGNFICVRPDREAYSFEDLKGVYLFLGYSKAEEKLLNPYTNMGVDDVVPRLRELVLDEQAKNNGTDCQLEVVEHIDENMIIQAMLEEYYEDRDNMSALQLHDIKDKCADSLEAVAERINSKDPEVRADVALSMVILAEVHIRLPPIPSAVVIILASPLHVLLGCILVLLTWERYRLPAS